MNEKLFEERALEARRLKESGAYNCAQAVAIALKDEAGLDEETLGSLTAGFCAGMGTQKATCGALVGANMVLGLKTNRRGTLRFSASMFREFESRCGASICKDLKTLVDGKPLCPCGECVYNAVISYYKATESL